MLTPVIITSVLAVLSAFFTIFWPTEFKIVNLVLAAGLGSAAIYTAWKQQKTTKENSANNLKMALRNLKKISTHVNFTLNDLNMDSVARKKELENDVQNFLSALGSEKNNILLKDNPSFKSAWENLENDLASTDWDFNGYGKPSVDVMWQKIQEIITDPTNALLRDYKIATSCGFPAIKKVNL